MRPSTLCLALMALGFAPVATAAPLQPLLQLFRQEFVDLRPGQGEFPRGFQMGNDSESTARPAHPVTLKHGFAIAKYEVPQNLWSAVTGSDPSRWKGPRNSVEKVTYGEAVAFCQRITELLQKENLIEPNQVVRLPTEAEWEYAARAGTDTAYSFGDDTAQLGEFGWFAGNAPGNDPPVGAKKPNPWGLFDVHGYLWEWCGDAWRPNYDEADDDGSARRSQSDATKRVIRGGSWKDPATALTSSFRRGVPPDTRDDAIGLRCVLADQTPSR